MKIMIVEGERTVVAGLLGNSPFGRMHEVVSAGNIADNLQPLWAALFSEESTSCYDLVVIDSDLPEVDAISLCQHLQTQTQGATIPILLLTSPGSSQHLSAIEAGADDYLTKPFDVETLISRISFLSSRQQRERLAAGRRHTPVEVSALQERDLQLQKQLAREQLIAKITDAIRQTLNIDEILQVVVEQVRVLLQTDRVIVLKFQPDWRGVVEAESVAPGWDETLGISIQDSCLGQLCAEQYPKGRVSIIYDVETASIDDWHRNLLRQFQVQANLVVPILPGEQLWGMLIVHQCSSTRQWTNDNTYLLNQVANQMGIAIQQAELYQTTREQAALIDIATDAILVRDLENRICFWNKGAQRIYGWSRQDALGQNLDNLLKTETSPELTNAWNLVMSQGEWLGELRKYTQSGKQLIIASHWSLMRDKTGQPISILSVDTDITEKKHLEAQSFRIQRMESLGTLAGGIAHDLNNILTPVLATAKLLPMLLPNIDEKIKELLDILIVSTTRGSELVKQVLTFARGIEGEHRILQVETLIAEVTQLIERTFPKSIEISTELTSGLENILGDENQLHQVLMNLCINARDAMPDGGRLTITAENCRVDKPFSQAIPEARVGAYVVIKVSDTGSGISTESLDQVFDPFFTTKETGKGTGLGLSTVLGIVKGHKGFVHVTSQLGEGTQFALYLPVTQAIEVAAAKSSPSTYDGQNQLILVVDDEASIRKMVRAILEAYNYRVLSASTGQDAISLYTEHQADIDIVLMDMMMPGMDGASAIRAIQEVNPAVNVIASSGLASSDRMATIHALGISTFLAKPYTPEGLLNAVNKIGTEPS